jgi:hypothetical protein
MHSCPCAGMVYCAYAQQMAIPSGSLSGKLTDIRSTPLENVTVILRNVGTGAQVRTTTARGGQYHFTGLIEGEYSLTATGPRGTGQVDGIFVAAGHEAHVHTALDFETEPQQLAARSVDVKAAPAVNESLALRLRALQAPRVFIPTAVDMAAKTAPIFLSTQPADLLPLTGARTGPRLSTSPPPTVSPSVQPPGRSVESSSTATDDLASLKLPAAAIPAAFVPPQLQCHP